MQRLVTPVILTYNEEPNIGRLLETLRWAPDIVVVDSGSSDSTVSIAKAFPAVRVFLRPFDSHVKQWNYAISETGISTEWILALDADHILTPEFSMELAKLAPPPETMGYRSRFAYCVQGRRLRGSAYPPSVVLYRRGHARYRQDGHTQRVVIEGTIEDLRSFLLHDDRKSLSHWLRSQDAYALLEAEKLSGNAEVGRFGRIRRLRFLAPLLIVPYCLFIRGGILAGWPGVHYAFQRAIAELLISLRLIERRSPTGDS